MLASDKLASSSNLTERLLEIVGTSGVITDENGLMPFLEGSYPVQQGQVCCVVCPASTDDVSKILSLCSDTQTSVVPQGGNTGLVGGQFPGSDGNHIILSTRRLNKVREVDPVSNVITVEAGVTLFQVQESAKEVGRFFPLSLASEGSCTVGGNLATNAGGIHVISYGMARDLVMGVEVVLASGQVISGLEKLHKNNTGYDLTQLLVGSEGTLGVITAATLKVFHPPKSSAVALIGLKNPEQAIELLLYIQNRLGRDLSAYELMPRTGLDLVLQHIADTRNLLSKAFDWYVIVEASRHDSSDAEKILEIILSNALELDLLLDAVISNSLSQSAAIWRLRESLPAALKRHGNVIKHDISLPVTLVCEFINEVQNRLANLGADILLIPFGHLGDGNIHYNVVLESSFCYENKLNFANKISEIVYNVTTSKKGSISAEHGVGRFKKELLKKTGNQVEFDVMKRIKLALDPKRILNPGVIFDL